MFNCLSLYINIARLYYRVLSNQLRQFTKFTCAVNAFVNAE